MILTLRKAAWSINSILLSVMSHVPCVTSCLNVSIPLPSVLTIPYHPSDKSSQETTVLHIILIVLNCCCWYSSLREAALNDLEAYIYKVKNRLSEDEDALKEVSQQTNHHFFPFLFPSSSSPSLPLLLSLVEAPVQWPPFNLISLLPSISTLQSFSPFFTLLFFLLFTSSSHSLPRSSFYTSHTLTPVTMLPCRSAQTSRDRRYSIWALQLRTGCTMRDVLLTWQSSK